MCLRPFLLYFLLLIGSQSFSQLQSPGQFLGYTIGTRHTPHWKIVDYFKHVAASVPSMVKVQQYGETNEGRPLVIAYVANSEHLSSLEAIRINNLKLAGMTTGSFTTQNAPAIVWLSFNVHGNETSSSEASMLALYSLADPSNTKAKEWLNNTVIIIDPCLNPDGRDRYVNWYQSVTGKKANPLLETREHQELWPGGRTNHYNFDLNRDWAWQTQIESEKRVALYNQWLPQIHVDFHEQGINSPYYFAPAAEPYHEAITPWQRSFQNIIGRNHARYFDEKGWLYFTKEVFDLLYPSYGDTYPIYNGSIGMTYEQAGLGKAGTAVITAAGDTLTLYDRVDHHFTTALSTIETASKNAIPLVQEFHKFFLNAATKGVGDYKTYIIKNNPNDREKILALLDLLKKNGIRYAAAKTIGKHRGFNYDSGKEENFTVAANDVIISSLQPKSTLVKVLFEPNPVLADTATYDITAWSLPYVYGVKAFAIKEKVEADHTSNLFTPVTNTISDPYAFVIRWSGMQSAKLVSQLLQKDIKLRFNQTPFETGGQSFDRGAVLVLKSNNRHITGLGKTITDLANELNVPLTAVTSGFVDKGYDFGSTSVRTLKKRNIALLTGEGVNANAAGEIWHFFDQVLNYPVSLINATDAVDIDWDKFDVLILPDGSYSVLKNKTTSDQLKDWVIRGGNLIAMENAVAQLSAFDWSLKARKDDTTTAKDSYAYLRKYGNRERDDLPNSTPGSIFKVQLDNTHPLAFGYPEYYYTLKQNDAIYEFIKKGGWNVGIIKKEKQVAGFVGSNLSTKLKDGLLFGTQELGNGNITYLADNVLFRSFWENGKLMFVNAAFLVGQ